MSTGALYSRALGEAGLRHSVASFSPEVHNAQITAQNRPLGQSDYSPLKALVEQSSNERLGGMLRNIERLGRTQPNLTLLTTPTTPILGSPSGRPFFLTSFAEHTTLTQGRWPVSGAFKDPDGDGAIEIVLGSGSSRNLTYLPGETVFLVPRRGSSERLPLKIVGVAEPINSGEEYWMGALNYFDLIPVGESVVVPIFVNEEDFFQGIGARYTTLVGDFGFNLFLDAGFLTAGNASDVKQQVLGLETDLNKVFPRTLVLSRLGLTVDEFERALTLARIPLYLYLSLVVVVVLYFLALITGTLGRSQAEEAGQLRSRGASVVQVSGVLAMAEAVVALVSMVVGPFLAWVIVKYLLLDTINPQGEFATDIPLGLAGDMFWMGALGGVLALAVLLITATGRARMGTLETLLSRTRPPSVPFLHRYYLDILAVATVLVIWFQVRGRDGFVAEELASQGINVDPTLILGPVLGLFAAAVLLLRVLPLVVRLLAWAGGRAGAAWFQFSLIRLSRDPIPHGSLAVILMLAAALGVFGATFQSSLSQGQSDQARYKIGGDMVVKGPALSAGDAEKLGRITGVIAVSPVLRDSVRLLDGTLGRSVDLLAVDPRSLDKTAWFRDDFYPGGLPAISRLLRPRAFPSSLAGTGIPLPEDSVSLGIWVDSSKLFEKNLEFPVNMWARVMTAEGIYRTFAMGNILEADGPDATDVAAVDGKWRLFTGDLSTLGLAEPPFELVAVFFSTTPSNRLSDGIINIDDVTAFGPSSGPDGVVIEEFEGSAPWTALVNQGSKPDVTEQVRQERKYGPSVLLGGADLQRSAGDTSAAGPLPHPGHRRARLPGGTTGAGQIGESGCAGPDRRCGHLFPDADTRPQTVFRDGPDRLHRIHPAPAFERIGGACGDVAGPRRRGRPGTGNRGYQRVDTGTALGERL